MNDDKPETGLAKSEKVGLVTKSTYSIVGEQEPFPKGKEERPDYDTLWRMYQRTAETLEHFVRFDHELEAKAREELMYMPEGDATKFVGETPLERVLRALKRLKRETLAAANDASTKFREFQSTVDKLQRMTDRNVRLENLVQNATSTAVRGLMQNEAGRSMADRIGEVLEDYRRVHAILTEQGAPALDGTLTSRLQWVLRSHGDVPAEVVYPSDDIEET